MISDKRPPEKGTPSNTINGSLLAVIDVVPLTCIVPSAPAIPVSITRTPATLPLKACTGLTLGIVSFSVTFTRVNAPVTSFLRAEP